MGCGRLGANIDLRYTPGGHAVARVLLAVDRYGKDGKKGTDWIRLVLWGRTAENAARFVGKGSKVTVMGRISSEFWERETDDGKKSQLTTEIVVVTEHAGRQVWGFRFGPAKTHRSKRPVSIPPLLVELLREHEQRHTAARRQAGPAWADLGLVFTDARGYPYKDHRIRRVFYKALEAAKVRRVVLYALRHTMATLVLHDTKDLKLVATRLGHRDETLLLRRYGHLLPGVDRKAADRLGELVRRRVEDPDDE
jgi:single stranded DNA-binding protein